MLNVLETTKSAYITASATNKVLTISIPGKSMTIEDDDLVQDSMSLKESIETGRSLTFKGCNASCFQFKVAGVVTDLRGQYIEATIQAGDTEEIPLFKGYIDTQDNLTHEDVLTEFTAYDVLYKVGNQNMQSWIDGLTFPITVKNFRNSLFAALGITQETVTLVNDSLAIGENIKGFLNNPTALDLMRWICQLNGRFGQIGRDGKFHYRKLASITKGLYPSSETFPSSITFPSGESANDTIQMSEYSQISYQPYETDKITKVSIYDNSGINQGNYGSGSNVWSISENPIAFSVNMSTASQNLYNEVKYVSHVPIIGLKAIGKPWLECGDTIMSYTRKNIVRTYILSRTITGIQALFDDIQSDSDKAMPPVKTTAMTGINANRQSVIEIQADIVQMNTVIAQKATIEQLNATNARVGSLEADHVTTAQLNAVSARVGSLEADHVTVAQLNATNANVQSLSTNKLDASTASITYATITTVDAVSARVGSLEADHVTTAQLSAVDGKINNLSAIAITTQNLSAQTINGSQITGLTISASQITSGKINANRLDADSISSSLFSGKTVYANIFNANYFALGTDTYGGMEITYVADVDFTNKTVRKSTKKFMISQ